MLPPVLKLWNILKLEVFVFMDTKRILQNAQCYLRNRSSASLIYGGIDCICFDIANNKLCVLVAVIQGLCSGGPFLN